MALPANDEIWSTTAERLGLSERTVEAAVLAMLWGGQKGLGVAAARRHLEIIVRRTLANIEAKNEFVLHAQGHTNGLPEYTSLAICTATERLCLWFRAHEVSDGTQLANYFETAYSYFAEHWKNRASGEVLDGLSNYETKLKCARAPKASRASRSQTARLRKTTSSSAVPSTTASSGSSNASGSRGESATNLLPTNRSPLELSSRPPPRSRSSNATGVIGGGAATERKSSIDGVSAAGEASMPTRFATSLEVTLAPKDPAQLTLPGVSVSMSPTAAARSRRIRPEGVAEARWIVLATGPAHRRVAAAGLAGGTAARRASLLTQDESEAGGTDAAGMATRSNSGSRSSVAGETSRPTDSATTFTFVLDDDADETNWWTRRYDEPEYDSDFVPEHSDGDPNSDLEDGGDHGDDEGKPTLRHITNITDDE